MTSNKYRPILPGSSVMVHKETGCPHPMKDVFTKYINGELSQPERDAIQNHADGCNNCSEALSANLAAFEEEMEYDFDPAEQKENLLDPAKRVALFKMSDTIVEMNAKDFNRNGTFTLTVIDAISDEDALMQSEPTPAQIKAAYAKHSAICRKVAGALTQEDYTSTITPPTEGNAQASCTVTPPKGKQLDAIFEDVQAARLLVTGYERGDEGELPPH